nr:hypothetical protein [Streptomyces sp. SID8354]
MLVYAAPVISVVSGGILLALKAQVDWYVEQWQIRRARKTLEKSLRYPHTSEAHKEEIRKLLEELDATVASVEVSRIKNFGAATTRK